ncbi:MAG: hypothetical protein R3244_03805 [Thermoanaerobaculia bacterium]|nr:hypothetical protein [Thermoanaerobaculia bacterium]
MTRPGARRRTLARAVLLLLLPVLGLHPGCAGFGARPAGAPPAERVYLLHPAEGWSGEIGPERSLWLYEQYRDLVERGEEVEVYDQAVTLLERDPGFAPARVLAAQVRYLGERYSTVVEELAAVVERDPGYVAAQVLYARAAELVGRTDDAALAYAAVADRSGIAAERLRALRSPVLEGLVERLEDELASGRSEAAARTVAEMVSLDPTAERTREAQRRLAELSADPAERLTLLRELAPSAAADPEIVRRRIELELEVGDVATAVELAENLAAASPADPGLRELVERARFRWRLDLLPEEVLRLTERPELTRGEFAVMLYWLFPGVRYGRPTEARIATDVIDDPHRTEIVRVINLGLMEVDETVHRFYPEARLDRRTALASLLELLDDSAEACLDRSGGVPGSDELVCEAAASCGLLVETGECLPQAGLSGSRAVELVRRALAQLGGAS